MKTKKLPMPVVWAIEHATRLQYSNAEFRIFVILANYVNGPHGAWPSMAQLVVKTQCSEREVRYALRRFEADGLVATTLGGGRGRTSRYHLRIGPRAVQSGEKLDTEKGHTIAPFQAVNGASGAPFKPGKGAISAPFSEKKGAKSDRKRGQPLPPESTKKNPLEESTRLRLENAVAFSPSPVPDFDPRKMLWTEGVTALKNLTGQLTTEAKKQIGRFLKLANGDAVGVLRALEVATHERPYEPIPWITAAIQARAARRLSTGERLRAELGLGTESFLAPGHD